MPRGGKRSTSFKPGVSGNPGGRPKKPQTLERIKAEADVKGLARECAPQAISILNTIIGDPKTPPAARIAAANAILDRGFGRPAQQVDVNATIDFDFSRLSDEEFEEFGRLLELTALLGPDAGGGSGPG
jgi:hypothetical protein